MKEHDIRPEEFESKQSQLTKIDAGRMLSRYNEFIEVECPACGSKSKKYAFNKYGMTYNNCTECNTIYISPRPSVDVLDFFYKDSPNYKFYNDYIFPASAKIRREKLFKPRAERIIKILNQYRPDADSLIEIGAAQGFFIEEIIKLKTFKQIVAIEPTDSLAEYLREKKIDVVQDLIENVDPKYNNQFDILVNFEVIEHLFSPKDFLLRCSQLLKKNGILFITCPNGRGFDNLILGPESDAFDYEHLNYFNPESIKILIKQCGFEVISVDTPGKLDVDIVNKAYNSKIVNLDNNKFIKEILDKKSDKTLQELQNFISENNLSGHLQVIARKK